MCQGAVAFGFSPVPTARARAPPCVRPREPTYARARARVRVQAGGPGGGPPKKTKPAGLRHAKKNEKSKTALAGYSWSDGRPVITENAPRTAERRTNSRVALTCAATSVLLAPPADENGRSGRHLLLRRSGAARVVCASARLCCIVVAWLAVGGADGKRGGVANDEESAVSLVPGLYSGGSGAGASYALRRRPSSPSLAQPGTPSIGPSEDPNASHFAAAHCCAPSLASPSSAGGEHDVVPSGWAGPGIATPVPTYDQPLQSRCDATVRLSCRARCARRARRDRRRRATTERQRRGTRKDARQDDGRGGGRSRPASADACARATRVRGRMGEGGRAARYDTNHTWYSQYLRPERGDEARVGRSEVDVLARVRLDVEEARCERRGGGDGERGGARVDVLQHAVDRLVGERRAPRAVAPLPAGLLRLEVRLRDQELPAARDQHLARHNNPPAGGREGGRVDGACGGAARERAARDARAGERTPRIARATAGARADGGEGEITRADTTHTRCERHAPTLPRACARTVRERRSAATFAISLEGSGTASAVVELPSYLALSTPHHPPPSAWGAAQPLRWGSCHPYPAQSPPSPPLAHLLAQHDVRVRGVGRDRRALQQERPDVDAVDGRKRLARSRSRSRSWSRSQSARARVP